MTRREERPLPLILVLANAALDDLFDLGVVYFIKAGWFDALQRRESTHPVGQRRVTPNQDIIVMEKEWLLSGCIVKIQSVA